MSDQEKKSTASAIASTVVMIEQTTDSRHKHPYRPTELHDENEIYQKHSKAPVVFSGTEVLKNFTEDSTNDNAEIRERKECERAMSSEKHKHAVGKKISTCTKRREPSPESIPLSPIEVDKKRGSQIPPKHPIPPDVDDAVYGAPGLVAERIVVRKPDEDSITEEIAELRTPEVYEKHSDWSDIEEAGGLPRSDSRSSRMSRMKTQSPTAKKEISWDDKEYQDNVVLKEMIARSDVWMLDRKASVGPCFRPGMPFEGPSGIMICLPKKSLRTINQASGISINISKKTMMSKTKLEANSFEAKKLEDNEQCNKEDSDTFNKFFANVKDKFTNLQSKMKRVFQV